MFRSVIQIKSAKSEVFQFKRSVVDDFCRSQNLEVVSMKMIRTLGQIEARLITKKSAENLAQEVAKHYPQLEIVQHCDGEDHDTYMIHYCSECVEVYPSDHSHFVLSVVFSEVQ